MNGETDQADRATDAWLVVAVQAAAWVWALVWGGGAMIAVGYGAAWGRALTRRAILDSVLEPDQASRARRSLCWDVVAPFAVTWAHLIVQIAAASSSRIRWGGWDYWVRRGMVVRMCRIDQKPAGN